MQHYLVDDYHCAVREDGKGLSSRARSLSGVKLLQFASLADWLPRRAVYLFFLALRYSNDLERALCEQALETPGPCKSSTTLPESGHREIDDTRVQELVIPFAVAADAASCVGPGSCSCPTATVL